MTTTTRVRIALFASAAALCATASGCASSSSTTTTFAVTSPGSVDSQLGIDSTCDGKSLSPALAWSNEPSGTKAYAIVMDHVPPEGGRHWYWIEWGIPSTTHAVTSGATDTGVFGGNSVNSNVGYAPPCSKGPGLKAYTITVYALSQTPDLPTASTASVNRETLVSAISGITLAKASIDLRYSR